MLKLRPNARLLSTLLLSLTLPGCAGMSETDCLAADWYNIGHRDGYSGQTRDTWHQRQQTCQKHHIAADRDAYHDGYEAGLDQFCTEHNGYLRGREGHQYGYVCPDLLEGEFLMGYQRGRQVYERRRHLAEHDQLLQEYSRELYYLNEDLRISLAQLGQPDIDASQQKRLARYTRRLQQRIYLLQTNYRQLQWRRNDLEHDLRRFEANQLR